MPAPFRNRCEKIAEARRLYDEGLSTTKVAAELGVSQSWAHRAIHNLSGTGRQNLNGPRGTMRCGRCGRPGISRPLCYVCINQDKAQSKEPPCRMVLSEWQKLADGTQMRTLTGM
jgi:hypothetical protein